MKFPKTETLKLLFVYGNITFVVVAGFYVLFALATRTDIADAVGPVGIFGGFVGMAIQFLTGSEIATRASKAAESNFASGQTTPAPPTPTSPPLSRSSFVLPPLMNENSAP